MNVQLPHLIFLGGLTVYIAVRAFYQIRAARQRKSVCKASLQDWLLVALIVVGQVVLPLVLLFSSRIDFANYALRPIHMWFGTPILVVALWIFWRSHADLGQNWSVTLELNPDHKLITQGVYRSIRHPNVCRVLPAIHQSGVSVEQLAGGLVRIGGDDAALSRATASRRADDARMLWRRVSNVPTIHRGSDSHLARAHAQSVSQD